MRDNMTRHTCEMNLLNRYLDTRRSDTSSLTSATMTVVPPMPQ